MEGLHRNNPPIEMVSSGDASNDINDTSIRIENTDYKTGVPHVSPEGIHAIDYVGDSNDPDDTEEGPVRAQRISQAGENIIIRGSVQIDFEIRGEE